MISPFNDFGARIFVLSGFSDDYFCLSDGRLLPPDFFLHEHLHSCGFNRIVFVSNKGVYFLDEASARTAMQDPGYSGAPGKEQSPAAGLLPSWVDGKLVRKKRASASRTGSITPPSKDVKWIHRGLHNSPNLVMILGKMFGETEPRTAVVLLEGVHMMMAREGSSPVMDYFRGELKNWLIADAPPANRNCLIFRLPYNSLTKLSQFLEQNGWDWVYSVGNYRDASGRGKLVQIGGPGRDEITALVDRNRLLNGFELDWSRRHRLELELTAYARSKPTKLKTIATWMEQTKRFDDSTVAQFMKRSPGESAEELMTKLVGMDTIKSHLSTLKRAMQNQLISGNVCQQLSYTTERLAPPSKCRHDQNLHVVLKGNPGTGKTTIARLFGEYYRDIGLLPLGHCVEVTRKDLVAGYVGQTALKTQEAIDRAMGGVLFVDEAYSLCKDENDSFGLEAVETLLKAMSDRVGLFSLIIAGYSGPIDRFLATNEGLKGRFGQTFRLPNYNPEQLCLIFKGYIDNHRQGFRIHPELQEDLPNFFKALYSAEQHKKDFRNAGTVIGLAQKVINRAFSRGSRLLERDDFPDECKCYFNTPQIGEGGVLERLDKLIGLKAVKEMIGDIFALIELQQKRGVPGNRVAPGHFLFMGNPGTGKTTVARVMAEQFAALEIFHKTVLHETTVSQLIKGYVGQTTQATQEFLEQGLGGVIFIDEAHQLYEGPNATSTFGKDVIQALVPFSENHRFECSIILAGYPQQMERMLSADPGLKGRFPNCITFEDYSPDEMILIFKTFANENYYTLDSGFEESLRPLFTNIWEVRGDDFDNARAVRRIFDQCVINMAKRIKKESDPTVDVNMFKIDDIPLRSRQSHRK